MKLKIYNRDNSKAGSSPKHKERTIRINFKAGLVSFSKAATEQYQFKEGDRLIFGQDEKDPKKWFFGKTTQESGFPIRLKDGASYLTNTHIAREILSSLKLDKNTGFLLALEPQKGTEEQGVFFEILTSRPLN